MGGVVVQNTPGGAVKIVQGSQTQVITVGVAQTSAGAFSPPSGTGFIHVTAGAMDAAARNPLASEVPGFDNVTVTGVPSNTWLVQASSSTAAAWVNPSTITVGTAGALTPGTAGQVYITNGTPAGAWSSVISIDSSAYTTNVISLAAGTQFGMALNSNIATTGHFRTSRLWGMGGSTTGADQCIMSWDGTGFGVLTIGSNNAINSGTVHDIVITSTSAIGLYNAFYALWGLYVQPSNQTTQIGSAVGNAGLAISWSAASPSIVTNYNATSFLIQMQAPSGNTTTGPFTIQGQYAFATATLTNRKPGNVVIDIGAPTNGGQTEGYVSFTRNGSERARIATHGTTTSQVAFWLGSAAFNADHSNAALISDGSGYTYVNVANSSVAFGITYADAGFIAYAPNSTQWLFGGSSTATASVYFNWTTTTTPIVSSGTAATSLTVQTNKAGASLILATDAALKAIALTKTSSSNNRTQFYDPSGLSMLYIDGNVNGGLVFDDANAGTMNIGRSTAGPSLSFGAGSTGVMQLFADQIWLDDHGGTYIKKAVCAAAWTEIFNANVTSALFQGGTGTTSFTLGTNKSGASLVLQGDTATTLQTLTTLTEFATKTRWAQVTAPAAPPAAKFDIYMDSADGKLKAISPAGTVTTLAAA